MDEFEREEIVEEEIAEEELAAEEQLAELDEDELPDEEAPEALSAEKPEKPIKGPRFWTWLAAVLLMLFGLVALAPAVWNTILASPAMAGLADEAGKNYESAMENYGLLYQMGTQAAGLGLEALGLTGGDFPMERQYAVWGKIYGPLMLTQSQEAPPIAQSFPEGVPKRLRELSAQCDALTAILEGLNAQLGAAGEPPEGKNQGAWILEGLEAARALDDKAKERALYYETIALYTTATDPEQKQTNLKRIEALRKDPAGAFWMYEPIAEYYAREDGDYDTLAALSDTRMKRNREDVSAMQSKVKALYLSEGADAAAAAADRYAKRAAAEDYMRLAKAEVYYREGKYDQAIALCDEMIAKASPGEAATPEAQKIANAAMEAVTVKATVLLLQGKAEEALTLLEDVQAQPYGGLTVNFAYALLAAYAANGDWEGEAAQMLAMQLSYSGIEVPQAILDLSEGKTTIEKIFTEGWGGFAA